MSKKKKWPKNVQVGRALGVGYRARGLTLEEAKAAARKEYSFPCGNSYDAMVAGWKNEDRILSPNHRNY